MGTTTTPCPWRGVGRWAFATSVALALACVGFAVPRAEPLDSRIALEQLGATDAARYREVFALQELGQWREADRAIRRLDSRLLMGRVLFQRYMHPTRYRSKYKELYDWMKAFADQPGANRIYRLALRRKPSGYKSPRRPSPALSRSIAVAPDPACRPPCERSAKQRRWVRKIRGEIRAQVRRGNPKGAEARLKRGETRRLLDTVEYDEMRRLVATGYFLKGDDGRALEMAATAAERSRGPVPLTDWTAGLAAWRLGQRERAAVHFAYLAHSRSSSGWNVAAGAFWAARANLVTGRAEAVNPMLERAAEHPHTFYGLIAARLLGRD
ncbi:MAG: hypothetical protein OXS50_12235, partial [Gammaproteobacteria bacterium]|nr:hypothetical protein [Gammaproteobacteria bacterium]